MVFPTTYSSCPKCSGIWFWSNFSAGALKCVECVPPPQSPKRGPGIIQPDGSLLTAAEITSHILDSNHRALIVGITKVLGPHWTYIKNPGLVIPVNIPVPVSNTRIARDVPDDLVIRPGDPQWVERLVIERAIESHRQSEQMAPTRVEGVKGEIVSRQLKRAALNPPRRQNKA